MKFIKNNLKVIIGFVIGVILASSITVYAYSYFASDIKYTDDKSVADALNDLYKNSIFEILETGTFTSTSVNKASVVLQTINLKNTYSENQNAYIIVWDVSKSGNDITPYLDFLNDDNVGLGWKCVGNSKSFYLYNGSGTGNGGYISFKYAIIREK